MNPHALLALISDLYQQLTAALERIAELEAELESRATRPDNDRVDAPVSDTADIADS